MATDRSALCVFTEPRWVLRGTGCLIALEPDPLDIRQYLTGLVDLVVNGVLESPDKLS